MSGGDEKNSARILYWISREAFAAVRPDTLGRSVNARSTEVLAVFRATLLAPV